MKKLILAAVLLMGLSAYGQTSDSFILRGTVLKVCNVGVTPTAAATTLDLIGAGHAGTAVAAVASSSNSLAGMRLVISGDTAGELVNQSDGSYTIPYTLDYVGSTSGVTTSGVAPGAVPAQIDVNAAPGDLNGNLSVNVTADPTLADGIYEANVTVACETL